MSGKRCLRIMYMVYHDRKGCIAEGNNIPYVVIVGIVYKVVFKVPVISSMGICRYVVMRTY